MMETEASLSSDSLDQVIERIFTSHRITRLDQRRFMSALLSQTCISLEDQIKINRVFEALQRGLLRVVD
ncbi:MAG TPA: hypothetical protein V6D13_00670 [Halomicronema sp.]